MTDQSPILDETQQTRHRYDELLRRLTGRQDLLELLSEYNNINNRLKDTQEWAIAMDAEINQKKQGGKDLSSLTQGMDDIKVKKKDLLPKKQCL